LLHVVCRRHVNLHDFYFFPPELENGDYKYTPLLNDEEAITQEFLGDCVTSSLTSNAGFSYLAEFYRRPGGLRSLCKIMNLILYAHDNAGMWTGT
jgi:hypothetical protein